MQKLPLIGVRDVPIFCQSIRNRKEYEVIAIRSTAINDMALTEAIIYVVIDKLTFTKFYQILPNRYTVVLVLRGSAPRCIGDPME